MARMRLRQRTRPTMGDDWLLPRHAGRWTAIGSLDSPQRGLVDPAGLVTVAGATWSLDWWIGAEDRWHLPCREVAVRQALIGDSPVLETRLRVPGGDAVHRTYGARSLDGADALVVEIENQSRLPFAVALAVRPHTQTGEGRIDRIELEGSVLRLDGVPSLVLARSPGRVALSSFASGDSAAVVFAGDAAPVAPVAVTCRDGLAQAALLFPLAHTATLRVVVPLDIAAQVVEPSAYPGATQVAAGWASHSGTGVRIEVPDRRLRDAVVASTRHLLLGAGRVLGGGAVEPDRAAVAEALDLLGYPAEAARLLTIDPVRLARSDAPGGVLHAVARHWELTRDMPFARSSVAMVAALVPRVGTGSDVDRARGRSALAGAAALLDAVGEARAADDVRAVADGTTTVAPSHDLGTLLSTASGTWTWASEQEGHDLVASAALVALVRDGLVAEHADGLALSPVVPDTWLGQGWELHDAPTRYGRISHAVRWHGDRPALLWELQPHTDTPITLRAPGLDPTWSTTERTGETLLAPVAIPERGPRRGLSIPVSIEPMPRGQG